MAVEAILPIFAEPFIKYVISPAVRHISYAFRCHSKVETLRNQVKKLKNKRVERQLLVDNAINNGEEIFPSVTEWLTTAGKEIDDADNLIRAKEEAMKKCFLGLCPNLKKRYQLSKRAYKKALAVGKHLEDAAASSDPISCPQPPQPIIEPSVYSDEALPSRELILNQIMDALKDPKLKRIGVYGMGGVGKTTLAKEVEGKARQEKVLFQNAVMVPVSQKPDVRKIQGEIADSLGLKLDAEQVSGRARRLHQRLVKDKVLIILDDVWQKLDLNEVGVPVGDAYEGCKILVTSRRKDILCNEMCTQKEFPLDTLKEEETWRLFEKSVSDITTPVLHQIATEIAKKCAGLPLLILKVAADLRGKESYAWSDMLNRLSNVESTDIYNKVHRVIESSYEELLDEEAKSLFLLCALFGDSNIKIHKLVMYSVGLGLFNRIESIEGVRNRVLALIDKLKDECLLLDGDSIGFTKMHDVVRDIAVVIASREQHAFVGADKVRSGDFQNKDYTRISLPWCDISKLPDVLDCPNAEVFSVFPSGYFCYLVGSFFEGVPKLKVVDFTRAYFYFGLPSSLGSLKGLQTLCLQACQFNNVAVISELKQLRVLSFAGSLIQTLPRQLKGLTQLKLLDLRDCPLLRVIPSNVLSNLLSLEELYISEAFSEWEIEGNASLEELKNLSHLKTIQIRVKDDKLLPKDWFFDGVENYIISIGPLYKVMPDFELSSRRILHLQLKTRIGLMHKIQTFVREIEVLHLRDVEGAENLLYDLPSGVVTFPNLTSLEVFQCASLKYVFTTSMVKSLKRLKKLEISRCESMEEIILSEEMEEENIDHIVFPQLDSLKLKDLEKLKRFSSGHPVDFPSVKIFEIDDCREFENLVSKFSNGSNNNESDDTCIFNELVTFSNLEEIYILRMIKLRNLWHKDIIASKNLRSIIVYKCPDLKCVFPALVACGLPQLEVLEIRECGVEAIFGKAKDEPFEWPNLTRLVVHACDGLKYIFTNSMVKSLKKLQVLEVSECESMEEIILSEDIEEHNMNKIVFPVLVKLRLRHLPNLKSFTTGHPIDFPSLGNSNIHGSSAGDHVIDTSQYLLDE